MLVSRYYGDKDELIYFISSDLDPIFPQTKKAKPKQAYQKDNIKNIMKPLKYIITTILYFFI